MTNPNNTSDQTQVTSNTSGSGDGSVHDDILHTLVGEGRKFKTVADLAKGKVEADSFIEKLTEENTALRALIRNADEVRRNDEALKEVLNRMNPENISPNGSPPNGNAPGQPATEARASGNQPQPLTSKDIELVYRQMRQREREDANEAQALQKITSTYGDQTEAFLTKKASELGLDVRVLKAMARQSPVAFLNLVGENKQGSATAGRTTTTSTSRGSVNTAAVVGMDGTSGLRDRVYYDKLKKEMGTKAFVMDRRLQIQMHKDMTDLGERWNAAA